MSLTEAFISRLEDLKPGDRARLRQLAGKPLDHTLEGFDLFTGLWWPLRQKSPRAPERRSAWLIAKLYGAFRLRNVPGERTRLPRVLGRAEPPWKPPDGRDQRRFRRRFDALLLSPLSRLEPHVRWALSAVRKAVGQDRERGIDWIRLLDDLRWWDRGAEEEAKDVREEWAEKYLDPYMKGV